MGKSLKICLIVALSLIAVAIVCMLGTIIAVGGDFTKFNMAKYQEKTYEIESEFDNISVKTNTEADITFALSQDDECEVVCYEAKKVKYTVSVADGALQINGADTRKWYEKIALFSQGCKITVYLPEKEYSSAVLSTRTGDIKLTDDFTFGALDIKTTTGDVVCGAAVTDQLKAVTTTGDVKFSLSSKLQTASLETTTGDVSLTGVTCNGVTVKTTTGEVNLSGVNCDSLSVTVDTGDVSIKNVIALGTMTVSTDTGDVKFEKSDAASLTVKTDTGDVTGTLLTEKTFDAKTDTGDVDVPKTGNGGKCEIRTDTGNIRIKIDGTNN